MKKLTCACAWSWIVCAVFFGSTTTSPAQTTDGSRASWGSFVETNFPFFSSVLDARKLGPDWPANNLTPRGLILNLGHDCWACFDTDLLRVSAMWVGQAVTSASMSQGSYHTAGEKAPEGQGKLPQMIGTPWLANGIYPGWQAGETISLNDPRDPGPDPREIGRGPIDPALGRFKAVRLTTNGLTLEYEVAGTSVREWIDSSLENERPIVRRYFEVQPHDKVFWLMVGRAPTNVVERRHLSITSPFADGKLGAARFVEPDRLFTVRVGPAAAPVRFTASVSVGVAPTSAGSNLQPASAPPDSRWPQTVTTKAILSPAADAYVLDTIALPTDNPWHRNVRLADVAFFNDGRAAAVTFDGDVWIISGLRGDLQEVHWKRFASGLHEPMGIAVRNDELFVFDRNGIWRLRDTDGNGEADVHELFSNAFAQTAETREFAAGMRVAPDGSFVIAKGGQEGTTIGRDNGTILRISPDGKSMAVLAYGLRQPFVAVHPKTGLVTATDQQGHYIPSTPIHIIRDHQYYGFIPLILPKEKYPAPIAEPLTWIPHSINASAAAQVWLSDAKMGPLNDSLIHIGYYRPEIFVTLLNQRGSRPQAAVISLNRNLSFAPLTGAVNPSDGQLYLTGFQIWGTEAREISGLARYRYTGASSKIPREVVPMDKGILLRFNVALDPKAATDPANYSAERWNYVRTASYGSPHFKLDGSKGQDAMPASSAYLSRDGKTVFLGIPDMKPVMQMRLGWALKTEAGAAFEQNAYFTPYELTRFDPGSEGFNALTVDLKPRTLQAVAATPITAEEGKRVSELMGCVACHSIDGSTLGKIGPSWKAVFGHERKFADGTKITADENYVRQSIREPAAKVVAGFDKSDAGMPSYDGVMTDAQIESLVLYIKSLQ